MKNLKQSVVIENDKSMVNDNDNKQGKQKMLIVEDNNYIMVSIQMQLSQIGVEFEACNNG